MLQLITLALPDGTAFKDYVLFVAGNIFIAILVLRSIGLYFKRSWGEMFGHIGIGVVLAGMIYATDAFIGILKQIWGLLSGTS